MKKLGLFLGVVFALTACKDKIQKRYMANVPVYTDYETFRATGGFEAPRSMEKQGNIYFKDSYLFMVEPDKGIHFIDNTNPSSPLNVGFLNVWGATGMAIKNNYLYVNSFIDLVVYDVSSFSNPTFVSRVKDIFPTALPTSAYNHPYRPVDKNLGVVTSWKIEEVKEEIQEGFWFDNCPTCGITTFTESKSGWAANGSSSGTGIAGSISLFTIVNDFLYVVENGNAMHPIEITNPTAPKVHERIITREIETLFPHNNYIFAGTPTGMLIYETANPAVPKKISSISHRRGCDPVVVQGNYAYVTVRSGGVCGGNINQMDVIDISSIYTPVLKRSFEFKNPHGLGIDGDLLFLCDGDAGLKVLDASNPLEVGDKLLHQFKNIKATDVIPFNNIAMVIGENGIYQYDYSDPSDLVFLSEIKF